MPAVVPRYDCPALDPPPEWGSTLDSVGPSASACEAPLVASSVTISFTPSTTNSSRRRRRYTRATAPGASFSCMSADAPPPDEDDDADDTPPSFCGGASGPVSPVAPPVMDTVYIAAPAIASRSPGVSMKVRTLRSSVLQPRSMSFPGSHPDATLETEGGLAYHPFFRAAAAAMLFPPSGSAGPLDRRWCTILLLLGPTPPPPSSRTLSSPPPLLLDPAVVVAWADAPDANSSVASSIRWSVHRMIPSRCSRRELNAAWVECATTRPLKYVRRRRGSSGPAPFRSQTW